MNFSLKPLALAAVVATCSMAAQAADTIFGSNFTNGTTTYSKTFADGLVATFTSAPGTFQLKSQDGITGVGISGKTAGEIDIGETVTGSFSYGVVISNIRLGLLFDGPEYGDVNEVAQLTANWTGGGSTSYTLTATGSNTAVWKQGSTILGYATGVGSISRPNPSVDKGTGAWDIFNPFGNKQVSSISFAALTGVRGSTCSSCSNQSDYTLVSVTAVPEVETYAMMLAGLGLMGTIARRRKARLNA